MMTGRTCLSPEERQHCFQTNLCLHCGGLGHWMKDCYVKGYGSAACGRALLSRSLTKTLISRLPISVHLTIIHLITDNHHKNILFHVIRSPDLLLILGNTWLNYYNHHIDWQSGQTLPVVLFLLLMSKMFLVNFLILMLFTLNIWILRRYLRNFELYLCLLTVVLIFQALHHPVADYTRILNLNIRQWTLTSLNSWLLHSSDLHLAGFILWGNKRYGGPCIDYKGLNSITIKNWYPLTFISSAHHL